MSKQKVLLTGSDGQLGSELKLLFDNLPNYETFYTDKNNLDITDTESIRNCFNKFSPEIVVNCAAYTAVDKCETDTENAFKLNATAVGYLAEECSKTNAFLIQISTDYVFDGFSDKPYTETDPTNPQSVYGKSKLEGERLLSQSDCKSLIIRTSWLYSSFGSNFVKTMLRIGSTNPAIRVVNDQIGSPTYALDLAKAIITAIVHKNELKHKEIFHFANEGSTSWFEFAKTIFKLANITCEVVPVSTEEYGNTTPRPKYSVFSKNHIKEKLQITIPNWEESLKRCLTLINN